MCVYVCVCVHRQSGWAEMIVVIGGCDRSGISRISFAEKFSPIPGKWLPSATLPGYSKCEFAMCELQNDIYLSGMNLLPTAIIHMHCFCYSES